MTDYPVQDGLLHPGRRATSRFDEQPRLVFWETTKACPLACVHCRAVAQSTPSPDELTTAEGLALIDELADGPRPRPVLILTGGDCLMREDLVVLAAHAHAAGVPVAIAPAVSPLLSPPLLRELYAHGVRRVSLSLDGASAAIHDTIRQVNGHFDATLDAVRMLNENGFALQINTAVMPSNVEELAELAVLLKRIGVKVWEVFFLVNVGRGDELAEITPAQAEAVSSFLVDVAEHGIVVRTVEGPFFRRVHHERASASASPRPYAVARDPLYGRLAAGLLDSLGAPTKQVPPPQVGTRDGKGIIFVAHNGDVYPSGFLPLSLGNVRDEGLRGIYRQHPLLRAIRAGELPGRCGHCEYTDLCGGSRARAFAASGDALGDDTACIRVTAPLSGR